MDRFSVVIAGGGVAAIEGLLRLRRLVGARAKITLLAPNEEFAFRALSVKEPFALGAAERHPVPDIARDAGAEWVQDTLEWVDPDGQVVHTTGGVELAYDALLLAIGSHLVPHEGLDLMLADLRARLLVPLELALGGTIYLLVTAVLLGVRLRADDAAG